MTIWYVLALWLGCSVLGYVGLRFYAWLSGSKWTKTDRVKTLLRSLAFGPIFVVVVGIVWLMAFCDDEPASW